MCIHLKNLNRTIAFKKVKNRIIIFLIHKKCDFTPQCYFKHKHCKDLGLYFVKNEKYFILIPP